MNKKNSTKKPTLEEILFGKNFKWTHPRDEVEIDEEDEN